MTAIIKVARPNFDETFVRWREGAIVCTTTRKDEAQHFSDFEAEAEARFVRLIYVRPGNPIEVEPVHLTYTGRTPPENQDLSTEEK